MPRNSPYVILLSSEERLALEEIARKYTSPYRDVVRAKVVLYAAQGLHNKAIAARLDVPRQIVSKWRKRFAEERFDGLDDLSRRGRPRVFSPQRRRQR
jgi:transposase